MSVEDAEEVLTEAATIKMPTFVYGDGGDLQRTSSREKIGRLEDFLLKTALWRGHLEEQRLIISQATRQLQRKWDHMTGWEQFRRNGEKSVQSVEDAKRQLDPDLYDSIQAGAALIKDISDQIRRLEHDDDVASRAYTFIVGGG